jgi:hypothetical protein
MTKTDEKWVERVRQWKGSSKTAEEFAIGQPFKASTLKWKASELRRASERAGGEAEVVAAARTVRMARVVRRQSVEVARGLSNPVVVEVSGVRIALKRGFDASLFQDVVRALGEVR